MIFPSPKLPRPSLNPAHFLLGYLMESFFFLRDSSPPVQNSIAAHRSPTFRPAALHKQIRYRIRISHSDPFFSSHLESGRLFWLMVWALSWYHVLCQEEKKIKRSTGFLQSVVWQMIRCGCSAALIWLSLEELDGDASQKRDKKRLRGWSI